MTESVRLLTDVASVRSAVDLEYLNSRAEMLTRVDRKYLVSLDQLATMMARLDGELDVLDIDGRRVFGYVSTYYDSPDLATFRAHVQRRRRRYKIRVRKYLDTGGQFVEIKYKGYRELTAKVRAPHAEADAAVLGPTGRAFAEDVIGSVYDLQLPERLDAVLQTANCRSTFLSRRDDARLTADVNVRFDNAERSATLRDAYALIETKSAGAGTAADRVLRAMNVRTTSVSKYCVGVALLRDDVPANPWRRLVRTHFEPAPDGQRAGVTLPIAG